MKNFRKNQGITLIALVITVIVLLILAGVTIATLTGDNGILTRAEQAKEKTEEAQEKESLELAVTSSKMEDVNKLEITKEKLENAIKQQFGNNKKFSVEENGDGSFTVKFDDTNSFYYVSNQGTVNKKCDRKGLTIGDYVEYAPDAVLDGYTIDSITSGYLSDQIIMQEDLKWRILNIYNDGSIELVSSIPTSATLYLEGAPGYNNGVYLLNNICKYLYSNELIGALGRSINIEDIEKMMNSQGITDKEKYSNEMNINYGNTRLYSNAYYPSLYYYENNSNINQNESFYNKDSIIKDSNQTFGQIEKITVTQTFYRFEEPKQYFDNTIIYDMLFNSSDENYWIATRNVNASAYAYFGLFLGGNNILTNHSLYRTDNTSFSYNHLILPIVKLNPETEILACNGNNSIDNMHKINYNK